MQADMSMLYLGSFLEHNLNGDEPANAISVADRDAYFACALQAFGVYLDRENVRHGLWKKYPARDQMQQIKIKAERVLHMLEKEEITNEERDVMLEELHDIFNYNVFATRIIKEGQVA